MESISDLLQKTGTSTTTIPHGSTTQNGPKDLPTMEMTALLVSRIFRELQVICTAWKNPIEGEVQAFVNDYKRALLDALIDSGVNNLDMIMRGIKSVRSEFLPNPYSFAKLCLPRGEDFGLPPFDVAYRQAVGLLPQKHPAVIFTRQSMGNLQFDLMRSTPDASRALFSTWWDKTVAFVAAGEKIPAPAMRIKKIPLKPPPEVVSSHIAGLRSILGERNAN